MSKFFFIVILSLLTSGLQAQPDSPEKLQQTAKDFMISGDFGNAIVVLKRANQQFPENIDIQKDLAMDYYLKKDYINAVDWVKKITSVPNVDEQSFQIAGNVYKAIAEVKECEKMYKTAIKKFPRSGPLYSEYGELLWERKDFSAIEQWEKGMLVAPAYSGNYYNAAVYYFYTKDKVWSLIYGEIFVNMESYTERSLAVKQMLLKAYKEKLFAEASLIDSKNTNEFSTAFLTVMDKQTSLASKGINTNVLTMIRTRFILDWYENYASKFPLKLFEWQQQLIKQGMFEAYNQWLFGMVDNLSNYQEWIKLHALENSEFIKMQSNRVFKMPSGQHYSVISK